MSLEELYNMNPKNYLNAQLGFGRMYAQNQQAEWERARWIACVIINPHLKKAISPEKITTFPWEKRKRIDKKVDIDKLIKESQFQDKLNEIKNK